VIVGVIYVSLWQYHEAITWGLLALITLVVLVWLARSINEMSLRRSRYQHQHETPLKDGHPTHLQAGEQPYPPYYAQAHYNGAQPHDREGAYAYNAE
jgi:hypothetical protein